MAVLSIQSHVVHGCAGNSAAVFPMQRLGQEVWAINTVDFSNHTGYGSWRGKVHDLELIDELVTGLEERGVLSRCEAVLSGYLGDAQTGKAILKAIDKVRSANMLAFYCCDPVMGDRDRGIYVKPGIPEIIKNELIPHAQIVCPNQFEIETLTGVNIETIQDAKNAIDALHKLGPSIVLVTSFKEKKEEGALPEISMLASDSKNLYKITTPELSIGDGMAGTGDLTSAVFLSHFLESNCLRISLQKTTAIVYGILEKSLKNHHNMASQPKELKIIESQDQFLNPSTTFKVEILHI